MFKNVASQKIAVYAFDATTGVPKTGDAAQLTAYVSKDFGSVTVLGDTSATEMDATNAKGMYLFDVTQTETNADCLIFTAKSSTSNIYIAPQTIYTDPASYTSFVTPTNLTAAQIATGVWQDTTAGDFTTALSVGKSVMNGVSLGTGLTVAAVSGAVGSVTGAVGSVTGAVGSVTGAVGSVTGNVGGNVVGTVASVVGAVGSVTGLTASNLDATVSSVKAKTDLIPGTQDGYTFAQFMLAIGAALGGKASGMATTTAVFRSMNDSKDRITATVDANGNRTAVTLDLT